GIDFELHADARNASPSGFELERKPAKTPIIARPFAFALQHVNQHASLIINSRCEHLAGFYRNSRNARNDEIHQAAKSFQTKRKRRDIEQEHIAKTAGEYLGLNGGAEGHRFIGILRGVQLGPLGAVKINAQTHIAAHLTEVGASEPFAYELAHKRHASLAADENHLIQVFGLQFGVSK